MATPIPNPTTCCDDTVECNGIRSDLDIEAALTIAGCGTIEPTVGVVMPMTNLGICTNYPGVQCCQCWEAIWEVDFTVDPCEGPDDHTYLHITVGFGLCVNTLGTYNYEWYIEFSGGPPGFCAVGAGVLTPIVGIPLLLPPVDITVECCPDCAGSHGSMDVTFEASEP
jgi:hypothetical protein